MSDEEHHFESKADAGASKTYPQQAGTIRKGGHIVIKGRACKRKRKSKAMFGGWIGVGIWKGKMVVAFCGGTGKVMEEGGGG
ncbi:hypothetical protein CsSME_00006732 [Camellia sinensis var. sinensis]